MTYKYLDDPKNDDMVKKHREMFGRYNDYPPNWKPISDEDFWDIFLRASVWKQEFRQMLRDDEPMVEAMLYFYFDETGLAIVSEPTKDFHRKPKFFRFAFCEHEMVGVPEESRMCYHVTRCKKCGYKDAIDSSG